MKWNDPRFKKPDAPYKPVLVVGKWLAGLDEFDKPRWTGWLVFTASWVSGPKWEMWPSVPNSLGRELKVWRWAELPEDAPMPNRDETAIRLARYEREARDEEFRRNGWLLPKRIPKGVTRRVEILEKSLHDYGPWSQRTMSAFDGRLPRNTRVWRPAN